MSRTEIYLTRPQYDAILTAHPEILEKAFGYAGTVGRRWSVGGVAIAVRHIPGPVLAELRDAKEEAITALTAE